MSTETDRGDNAGTVDRAGLFPAPTVPAALTDVVPFICTDVAREDISALVLTHAHPDHIGLAGLIVGASDCAVYMLPREAERMYRVWGEYEEEADDRVIPALEAMYRIHGLPNDALASVAPSTRAVRKIVRLPPRESANDHHAKASRR